MLNDNEHDEILGRLLKKVEPDTPTSEFVDLVMEELAFETERQEMSEVKLASLLKNSAVEKTSIDFTEILMEQIRSEVNSVNEPIISKTGWYAIAITLGITLIAIGFSGSNNVTSTSSVTSSYFERIGQSLTSIIGYIHSFPSMFLLMLIPICLLLVADYFWNYKDHSYSQKFL